MWLVRGVAKLMHKQKACHYKRQALVRRLHKVCVIVFAVLYKELLLVRRLLLLPRFP